jgi:hypothetical protein
VFSVTTVLPNHGILVVFLDVENTGYITKIFQISVYRKYLHPYLKCPLINVALLSRFARGRPPLRSFHARCFSNVSHRISNTQSPYNFVQYCVGASKWYNDCGLRNAKFWRNITRTAVTTESVGNVSLPLVVNYRTRSRHPSLRGLNSISSGEYRSVKWLGGGQ